MSISGEGSAASRGDAQNAAASTVPTSAKHADAEVTAATKGWAGSREAKAAGTM